MAGSLSELAESLRAIDDAHEVVRGRRPTRLVFGSEQVEIAKASDVNALLSALASAVHALGQGAIGASARARDDSARLERACDEITLLRAELERERTERRAELARLREETDGAAARVDARS